MTPPSVIAEHEDAVAVAVDVIGNGGAVVLPTDTVYGLAVSADDELAVDRLFGLKQRPKELSIAILVADLEQATTIARVTEVERRVAEHFWPGPLTLVLPRRSDVGPWVGRNDGTVAVRCPDRRFVRSLAQAAGPLATTSANLSGEPTSPDALEAAGTLAGPVELVVDGGLCSGEPSTVARVEADGQVSVFRAGAINAANLGEIAQNLG